MKLKLEKKHHLNWKTIEKTIVKKRKWQLMKLMKLDNNEQTDSSTKWGFFSD
jgi:hypothetical protein